MEYFKQVVSINISNLICPFLRPSRSGRRGKSFIHIYAFLNGKYYFDVIYNQFIVVCGFKLAYKISKELDRGIIEVFGPYGLSSLLANTGIKLSKLDTGVITTYALYITLSLIALLMLVFAPYVASVSDIFSAPAVGTENNFFDVRLFILFLASALIVTPSREASVAPRPYFFNN